MKKRHFYNDFPDNVLHSAVDGEAVTTYTFAPLLSTEHLQLCVNEKRVWRQLLQESSCEGK